MIVSFLIGSLCEAILVVCGVSFLADVSKCTIVVRKHFGIKFIACVLFAIFIKIEKSWRKMQKIFKKQESDSSPTPPQEQPAGWQLPLRQSVGEIRQQRFFDQTWTLRLFIFVLWTSGQRGTVALPGHPDPESTCPKLRKVDLMQNFPSLHLDAICCANAA